MFKVQSGQRGQRSDLSRQSTDYVGGKIQPTERRHAAENHGHFLETIRT